MTRYTIKRFFQIMVLATLACVTASAKSPVMKQSTSPRSVIARQANAKPIEVSTPNATPVQPVRTPAAGERIDWQVVSDGGTTASSANYVLTGTVDQTAVGSSSSSLYLLLHGFWQEFPDGCCVGVTGNVDLAGIIDLTDLSALIQYLTGFGYVLPCTGEANVDATGIVDLTDLSALVSYLSSSGYVLPNCP